MTELRRDPMERFEHIKDSDWIVQRVYGGRDYIYQITCNESTHCEWFAQFASESAAHAFIDLLQEVKESRKTIERLESELNTKRIPMFEIVRPCPQCGYSHYSVLKTKKGTE